MLSALQSAGVGQFVFSSTCATYGEPQRTPIDEKHRSGRPTLTAGRSS